MKKRYEVLDRLRACAFLSYPQRDTWGVFKEMWDQKMRTAHDTEWGMLFAEEMKQIVTNLQNGDGMSLSHFMESERKQIWQIRNVS